MLVSKAAPALGASLAEYCLVSDPLGVSPDWNEKYLHRAHLRMSQAVDPLRMHYASGALKQEGKRVPPAGTELSKAPHFG